MIVERMIELLEIEKECVLRNAIGKCNRYCAGCDLLQDDTELHEMYTEAIALLKAQEPRVMTLEEVAGRVALGRETPIYMEFGYMATHAGQVIGLKPKYMYFDDENGLSWDVCEGPNRGKKDGVSLDEYNDIWRCWTSRPDEATREATPWN